MCHERILYRVRVTAQEMRVWPLEAGLQEQASNHLKLLWSKAMVVSVKEKSRHKIVACQHMKYWNIGVLECWNVGAKRGKDLILIVSA